ncbi:MAG: HDOD domain-containing protein [candidate division Zixibacteria bacterium]|nr:HDOD domain-containing protein [candidate division Zixibacteria bacterium]
MNSTLSRELRQKLERFSNLPSIPQIIFKIKQVSDDPKSSATDLANCILSDHQLTSRILRMANSSYYGNYAGKINTVTHAIVMMGFRAVHNIAISMSVYDVVNKLSENSKFDLTSFWTRSLASGIVSKYLAHHSNQSKLIEVAFIAGFIHDIGQAILACAFPDKYGQIGKLDPDVPDICETERVLLEIDHQEAGEYIARIWNLPDTLSKPISSHHRIDLPPNVNSEEVVVDLVYLSDLLYPHVMGGTDPESPVYRSVIAQAQALIQISKESMVDLLTVCREQVSEIAKDLQIDIDDEFEQQAVRAADEDEHGMREQISNQEVQLAFLRNSTRALMEAKATDEILQVVCEALFRGLQMGVVIVFEYDSQWDSFAGKVGFGLESQQAVQALNLSAKGGLFEHLRKTGNAVTFYQTSPEFQMTRDEIERLKVDSFAAVPLQILDDVQFVVLAAPPREAGAINDDTLASIISLTNQAGMVLERNLLKAKLMPS